MGVIQSLAARYCVREDAAAFMVLWALIVALGGGAVAMAFAARRGSLDQGRRRVAFSCAVALGCLILLSLVFGETIFRWCHQSAAASLGMSVPSLPGRSIDAMICLSPHALGMTAGWILIVVFCLAAVALLALGVFQIKNAVRRALAFAGAGVALLLTTANIGLVAFGVSWCQSQRLF